MLKYCREVFDDYRKYDPRSFRYKTVKPGTRVLIACPKGYWDNKNKVCKISTKLISILHSRDKGYCPPGIPIILSSKVTGDKPIPFKSGEEIEKWFDVQKQKGGLDMFMRKYDGSLGELGILGIPNWVFLIGGGALLYWYIRQREKKEEAKGKIEVMRRLLETHTRELLRRRGVLPPSMLSGREPFGLYIK